MLNDTNRGLLLILALIAIVAIVWLIVNREDDVSPGGVTIFDSNSSSSCVQVNDRTDEFCYPPTTEVTIGDLGDLAAASTWASGLNGTIEDVDMTALPLGSSTGVIGNSTSFSVAVTHRDDEGYGPGSGTLRSFTVEDPVAAGGATLPNTGLQSVGGGTTTLNSFEFILSEPVGAFGLDTLDLESSGVLGEQINVRAYDEDDVLLASVFSPTDANDEVQFFGVTDSGNRIKAVRVSVGDNNGGTLAFQLAVTNFKIGLLTPIIPVDVIRTISANGDAIEITHNDVQTGAALSEATVETLQSC